MAVVADPIETRRIVVGILGGVLAWRSLAALAGLPPIVGTLVGIAGPVASAAEARGRTLPRFLSGPARIAGAPGGWFGDWAYPENLAYLPEPIELVDAEEIDP